MDFRNCATYDGKYLVLVGEHKIPGIIIAGPNHQDYYCVEDGNGDWHLRHEEDLEPIVFLTTVGTKPRIDTLTDKKLAKLMEQLPLDYPKPGQPWGKTSWSTME
jgi:hypothetical protein